MRIAIISIAIGDKYIDAIKYGMLSLENYSIKNKYDLFYDNDYDKSRLIYWAKVKSLIKYIDTDKYDYVVWIDADTIIMNDNIKLEDIITKYMSENIHTLMCMDNGLKYNTGVWFLKSSEYSKNILELIYNQEQFLTTRMPEQDAFEFIYNNNMNELKNHSVILQNNRQHEFNCSMYDYKENGLLIHFLGIHNLEHLSKVTNDHYPYRQYEENSYNFFNRMKWIRNRYSDYKKTLKIGLCSFSIGDKYKEKMKLGIKSKQLYCKKHGYDFIDDETVYDNTRPFAWSKILMIKKYLPYYDYVVWMDADTMIMNDNIKLENIIGEHENNLEFLLTRDVSNTINTGIIFVKYSYLSFIFLDLIYSKTQFINTHYWEQDSFNDIYENDEKNFKESCKILPMEKQNIFNCPVGLYTKDTFLIHFYGPRCSDWIEKSMKDFCPFQKENENDNEFNYRKKWIDLH